MRPPVRRACSRRARGRRGGRGSGRSRWSARGAGRCPPRRRRGVLPANHPRTRPSPSRTGVSISSRRAATGAESSVWRTVNAVASPAIATNGTAPTIALDASGQPAVGQRWRRPPGGVRRKLPGPQQLSDVLERPRPRQLGDVVTAVAHAVLVERRNRAHDLYVDRRTRLSGCTPAAPGERLEVADVVEGSAAIDGEPTGHQAAADVCVERRLLHPEATGGLGRADVVAHGVSVDCMSINVDSHQR